MNVTITPAPKPPEPTVTIELTVTEAHCLALIAGRLGTKALEEMHGTSKRHSVVTFDEVRGFVDDLFETLDRKLAV